MATCAQLARETKATTRPRIHPWLFVALAVALPILAGLVWHFASDNPAWPLLRHSLNVCELSESQVSLLSPDGSYRAHVVRASCFGRFNETLVFVTGVSEPWSMQSLDPDRAVLEIAGLRSLDSITWQDTNPGTMRSSSLQLAISGQTASRRA